MRLEAHLQDRSEAVYLMNKILGKRYNWEEANILITKITANVIVTSLLRTFRPSSGAIFNAQ